MNRSLIKFALASIVLSAVGLAMTEGKAITDTAIATVNFSGTIGTTCTLSNPVAGTMAIEVLKRRRLGGEAIMSKLTFSALTLDALTQVITLIEQEGVNHKWTHIQDISLTEDEQRRVQEIQNSISTEPIHLMNESTIWARAIYPLLMLAEQDSIRAWGEVNLNTAYPTFELDGIADGVLGKSVAGRLKSPYLVVVETKRGIEAQNPLIQLYGQLLAAAHLNWKTSHNDPQEVFGCYTIADSWTFVRAEVMGMETDKPSLTVELSKEYTEKVDAASILKLLKQIVASY